MKLSELPKESTTVEESIPRDITVKQLICIYNHDNLPIFDSITGNRIDIQKTQKEEKGRTL